MRDKTRTALVRNGYDRISNRYTAWASADLSPGRRHALAVIDALVPAGADVLDLGCGAGLPMTAALARRYRVHGVDISAVQVEHARHNVPDATFEQADLLDFTAAEASFDAVVAFYSLTHVPRDAHSAICGRIYECLRPSGLLVASLGVSDDPGTVEDDWLGAPMFFSHFDAKTNVELIVSVGFALESATVVTDPEDDGTADFLWVVARKP